MRSAVTEVSHRRQSIIFREIDTMEYVNAFPDSHYGERVRAVTQISRNLKDAKRGEKRNEAALPLAAKQPFVLDLSFS